MIDPYIGLIDPTRYTYNFCLEQRLQYPCGCKLSIAGASPEKYFYCGWLTNHITEYLCGTATTLYCMHYVHVAACVKLFLISALKKTGPRKMGTRLMMYASLEPPGLVCRLAG